MIYISKNLRYRAALAALLTALATPAYAVKAAQTGVVNNIIGDIMAPTRTEAHYDCRIISACGQQECMCQNNCHDLYGADRWECYVWGSNCQERFDTCIGSCSREWKRCYRRAHPPLNQENN